MLRRGTQWCCEWLRTRTRTAFHALIIWGGFLYRFYGDVRASPNGYRETIEKRLRRLVELYRGTREKEEPEFSAKSSQASHTNFGGVPHHSTNGVQILLSPACVAGREVPFSSSCGRSIWTVDFGSADSTSRTMNDVYLLACLSHLEYR